MFDRPLTHIIAHRFQEKFVAQHVLQVVKHHGGLVVRMTVAHSEALLMAELIAVRIQRRKFVAHRVPLEPVVHFTFTRKFRAVEFPRIEVVRYIFHERVTIDPFQAPGGEELGESLIHESTVGLVAAEHSEEPVVPHFVHEQRSVTGIAAAIEREHRVFHAVACIGHDHLRVGIHAEVGAEHFDDPCRVLRSVLPAAGVRLLRQGDAAYAIPFRFADAVGGIGSEGKIVYVLRMESPDPALRAVRLDHHGWPFVPGFILEIDDVQFRSEIGRHHFFFILKNAGGIDDVVVRKVELDIERAEIAVEFMAQMLLRIPAEFPIVHRDPRVPMHTVVMFPSPGVEELHSALHAHGPMGGETDPEGDAIAR